MTFSFKKKIYIYSYSRGAKNTTPSANAESGNPEHGVRLLMNLHASNSET